MPRSKVNPHHVENRDGEDCVVFTTDGKTQVEVIVDLTLWEKLLHQYHWTAIQKGKKADLVEVKSTKKNQSKNIARIIVEESGKFCELDYFGKTVDHINHKRWDNRLKNLRLCNPLENANNIGSTQEAEGMEMIFQQKSGSWKVHAKFWDTTYYRNFQTLEEAKRYRDTEVKPDIERRRPELAKKIRDVEFERGLRDKLDNGERTEVLEILRRHGVI